MITVEELKTCQMIALLKHTEFKTCMQNLCDGITPQIAGKIILFKGGAFKNELSRGIAIRLMYERGALSIMYHPWYSDHATPTKSRFKTAVKHILEIKDDTTEHN